MPQYRKAALPQIAPPAGPGTGGIFISYRRGIDNDSAGRLFDRLAAVFPESRIFRDVDSALDLLGLDFHQVLTERVQGCAVLVAVIGRGWVDSIPRLAAEGDFVRIELAAALARADLRLIPVLVGDVDMPSAETLPEELRPLVRRGAIRLTNEGYSKAVETVIRAIAQVLDSAVSLPPSPRRHPRLPCRLLPRSCRRRLPYRNRRLPRRRQSEGRPFRGRSTSGCAALP